MKKSQKTKRRLKKAITAPQQVASLEGEQLHLVEVLQDTVEAINSGLDFNKLLEHILTNVGQIVLYDTADIMLLEGAAVRVVNSWGYTDHGYTPILGMSFLLTQIPDLAQMAATRQPLAIADTRAYPNWADIPETRWVCSYAGAPIRQGGQVIGFLNLNSASPGFYTAKQVQRLQFFADYLGIAFGNTRLIENEREQRELAGVLCDIGITLSATLDFDALLDCLLEQAARLVPYDTANIFLIEGNLARIVRTRGYERFAPKVAKKATTIAFELASTPNLRWLTETGHPLIIPDTITHPGWVKEEIGSHIRSWAGVPIMGHGQVIAIFSLDKIQSNYYQPKHAKRLALFAGQVALALENSRLFESEARRRRESEALRRAALALTSTVDMDQVLERLLTELHFVVPYDSASVQLLNEGYLKIINGRGFSNLSEVLGLSFPVTNTIPNNIVITSKKPHIIDDVTHKYQTFNQSPHHQAQIRSWLGVPLLIGDQIIGMITLDKQNPNFYTEIHAQAAMTYAAQAAIAIENAHLYRQTQYHAAELEQRVNERTFELQVLYELAQALSQATQLSDIIRLILLHLYRAIPHDVSASLLITEKNSTLVIQSHRPLEPLLENHLQEIMCASLDQCQQPPIVRRIEPKAEGFLRQPIKYLNSVMQVLIELDQIPVGVLLVAAEQPNQFNQEQMHLLRTAADQAAESIRRLQSLLAAEHQRLKNLVAHLPDGVILLDTTQRVVLANQVAQQYLTVLTPTTINDRLIQLGHQPLKELLSTTGSCEIEIHSERHWVFKIDAESMAVGPEAGGWVLVIRDITEERTNQEFIQQQDRLAAVGQLAAGIAHDFNNILTSMIGFTELVLLNPDLSSTTKEDLQRIVNQGQRAARLIRQILDFSRQSVAEKQRLELAPFLKETVKLLERTIQENIQITLEIEPEPEGYILNADPVQLQQVLTNLAVNARDAMPAGGTLQFRLSILRSHPYERLPYPELAAGQWIVLSISDTGPGISPEVLPHIFEPFFTTKEVGKGTGLGLAQVYGVITQHNGYIDVKTQVNRGTTFILYLPALPTSPQNLLPANDSTLFKGQGELILLVEDDFAVLEVTASMLKHLGYQVITATNGREALEIYEQHQTEIALVLTDITMPEMGGLALAQTLQVRYPTTKIVALSGYPLESMTKNGLAHGIIDWLQKPLTKHQLAQTISQLLMPQTSLQKV